MIFGKKANAEARTAESSVRISIFDTAYPIDKSNWRQVYSACLGKMMVIQNACAEQVAKGRNWNVDFGRGTLAFGNDEYPVQFLGSESSYSNTWMWGWNNINGFDEKLIRLAREAKKMGEAWNLEPLTTDTFDLDDTFNGHNLSIVACGISGENYCYYRGPHEMARCLWLFQECRIRFSIRCVQMTLFPLFWIVYRKYPWNTRFSQRAFLCGMGQNMTGREMI